VARDVGAAAATASRAGATAATAAPLIGASRVNTVRSAVAGSIITRV
jgi:hypothetical protein